MLVERWLDMPNNEIVDGFYKDHYQSVINSGAVGFVAKLMHKSMEKEIPSEATFDTTLELGAGAGQHLDFVKHNFQTYIESDIRKENLPIRNGQRDKNLNHQKIVQLEIDATTLVNFEPESIHRIIATCLLVHLSDPESALINWRKILIPGGVLTIYVPCEPGIFLRFLRSMTTRRKAAKRGVNHDQIHHREHLTYFGRIDTLINDVFAADQINRQYFPFRLHSWNMNLWVTYQIKLIK